MLRDAERQLENTHQSRWSQENPNPQTSVASSDHSQPPVNLAVCGVPSAVFLLAGSETLAEVQRLHERQRVFTCSCPRSREEGGIPDLTSRGRQRAEIAHSGRDQSVGQPAAAGSLASY